VEKQQQKKQEKKERTKELEMEEEITKSEYNKKKAQLGVQETELLTLLEETDQQASEEEIKEILKSIKKEWPQLSDESKKLAIHSLFSSLTVDLIEPTKPGKYPVPPVVKISDYSFK